MSDLEPVHPEPRLEHTSPTTNGNDVVCFTAGGIAGAAFAAGTIHAYLAAERKCPAVAAGISMGAVSAAALQRCYRELQEAEERGPQERSTSGTPEERKTAQRQYVESVRWQWFRRYLLALSDLPLNAFWDAIPDQSDFFTDRPPIRNSTLPPPLTRDEEATALQERYWWTKLGQWFGILPIRVADVTNIVVHYVRWKEKYPGYRWWRGLRFVALCVKPSFQLLYHVCRGFFPEYRFVGDHTVKRWFARPLFGWSTFLAALLVLTALVSVSGLLLLLILEGTRAGTVFLAPSVSPYLDVPFVSDLLHGNARFFARLLCQCVGSIIVLGILFWGWLKLKNKTVWSWLLEKLGVQTGFLTDFYLRVKLAEIFSSPGMHDSSAPTAEKVSPKPMPVLLVSLPLQVVRNGHEKDQRERLAYASGPAPVQFWAADDTSLIDALRTALAVPVLFSPTRGESKDRHQWQPSGDQGTQTYNTKSDILDLVDAAAVRANPLPALFDFLRQDRKQHGQVATRLEQNNDQFHPAIHVVYSIPINRGVVQRSPIDDTETNIVDVARRSFLLSRRRDTQVEVAQTNYIAYVEDLIQTELKKTGRPDTTERPPFRIFAEEIGPEVAIKFKNSFNPSRDEILSTAAAGCRQTLQTLYANELRALPGPGLISCYHFLRRISAQRLLGPTRATPGVPEVCKRCVGTLAAPPKAPVAPTNRAHAIRSEDPFPAAVLHTEPKIVFVASGGVFRGAFHVGMIAAFHACGMRPDLIVGASVGALLGATLGVVTAFDRAIALETLSRLVTVFLHVDEKIALTSTLKSATRELGIQGATVQLSPARIARLIRRGSRADAGFAATGAPPSLIDAISSLFLLPYRETSAIAAAFIAGHVTDAVSLFFTQVKKDTLRRLRVQEALMGTSLLEREARRLLTGGSYREYKFDHEQPFYLAGRWQENKTRPVMFFATATDLGSQSPYLLGHESKTDEQLYDFIAAVLASSAFPGVFAPRRESEIFPGRGNIDVRLADGGMFDNLPFFPAVDILMQWQRDFRRETVAGRKLPALAFLQLRHENPDLFIAGSLTVPVENDGRGKGLFTDLGAIRGRVASMHGNAKIRSFEQAASTVDSQVERLLHAYSCTKPAVDQEQLDARTARVVDGIVNAAVLPVFPSAPRRLNGTFAFCASLGLERARVQRSMADGCFQTLKSLLDTPVSPRTALTQRSVDRLRERQRIPRIVVREQGGQRPQPGECPYFKKARSGNGEPHPFLCPFYEVHQEAGQTPAADAKEREDARQRAAEAAQVYDVCIGEKRYADLGGVGT